MYVSVTLTGPQLLHLETICMFHQILCKLYHFVPKKFEILDLTSVTCHLMNCAINICGEHNF